MVKIASGATAVQIVTGRWQSASPDKGRQRSLRKMRQDFSWHWHARHGLGVGRSPDRYPDRGF
jgi:hypothetical protein